MEQNSKAQDQKTNTKENYVIQKKEETYGKKSNHNQSQLESYSQVATLFKQKK